MIILDTNVVSENMQPRPSPEVAKWLSREPERSSFFVTVITVAEILYGVEILPGGKRKEKLQQETEAVFAQDFQGRILDFSENAARMFSKIASSRRAQGRPISEFDAQIAAIVRIHDATLATRNVADFEGCGVRLVNPWQA